MNAELKAKWIEALRSGEYRQGVGRLYDKHDQSHRCLGVLCRVADLQLEDHGNGVVGVPQHQDDYQPIYDLLGSSDIASDLWKRNDGVRGFDRHPFEAIADYIERTL